MQDVISKLYYEAHITIEPVFDERLEAARVLAEGFEFRVADLLMQKREEDTPERSKNDTFMTGHATSLNDIKARVSNLVAELKIEGFTVWRYKIEDTIMDSRAKDVLGIL